MKEINFKAILVSSPATKETGTWEKDSFRYVVSINNQEFDYFKGSAHVTEVRGQTTPVYPTLEEVIECLILDSDCAGDTFEDFCGNLGYDTDSRKALDTYLRCQENTSKLRKTGIDIEAFREKLNQ